MAQSKKVRARNRKTSKDSATTIAHQNTLEAIKERKCRIAAFEAEIFGSPFAPRRHTPENTRAPLKDEYVVLLIAAIRQFIRPCPFLTKLPVEIRVIIYGYVFDGPYETYGYSSDLKSLGQEGKEGLLKLLIRRSRLYDDPVEPPILKVCRQIRQEAYHEYLSFMEARQSRKAQEMDEYLLRSREDQAEHKLSFWRTGFSWEPHL